MSVTSPGANGSARQLAMKTLGWMFQVNLVWLSLALASVGCAHRLGPPGGADPVRIEIGKTTKAHVLNHLGLPTTRAVEGQLERWGYTDGPVVSSVQVASVADPKGVVLKTLPGSEQQPIVMVYVFDATGVLVEVNDMRGER